MPPFATCGGGAFSSRLYVRTSSCSSACSLTCSCSVKCSLQRISARYCSAFDESLQASLSNAPQRVSSNISFPLPFSIPRAVANTRVAVVWLRNDLRLHDHPALHAALSKGYVVAPVVISRDITPSPFWTQSVSSLRNALRSRGAELYVRTHTHIIDFINELARAATTSTLFFHAAFDRVRAEEERSVSEIARANGIVVEKVWGNCILEPTQIPGGIECVPEHCDEFAHAVQHVQIRTLKDIVGSIRAVSKLAIDPGEIPCASDATDVLKGGEQFALQIANEFINGKSILLRRNATFPRIATKFSSLMPYLQLGCISPRKLYMDVVSSLNQNSLRRHCAEMELRLLDFFRLTQLKVALRTARSFASTSAQTTPVAA